MIYIVTETNPDMDDGWTQIRGVYDNEEQARERMEVLSDRIELDEWDDDLHYSHGSEYDYTYMSLHVYELNAPVFRPWGDVR